MNHLAYALRVAQSYYSLPAGETLTLSSVQGFIYDIVNGILIVSGLIVTGVIVWAGIVMATSGNNENRYKSAKETLKKGLWGALIILGVGTIANTIASFARAPTQIFR